MYSVEILVHAFVSSKLDYCNSLLYNIPKYVLNKLQFVQNAAARLITCSRKYVTSHNNNPDRSPLATHC